MDNNRFDDMNSAGEAVKASAAGRIFKEVFEWIMVIVIAVAVAFLIRHFVFTMVRVDGASMDNTLAHGDRLCVVRLNYKPDNGDIIVFNPFGDSSRPYIKRVIALGGQSIFIDIDGSVYVDGEVIEEDYLGSFTATGISFPINKEGLPTNDMTEVNGYVTPTKEKPYVVPEGYVFAMGDNRSASHDCRSIGPVKVEDVVGRAVFRVYPFDTFGTLK